ncbi:Bardet-Biedl syndrome 4 protein [Vespula maculifrons]|uniref:Bardet-Biedl syndrome 4 protein n=1 Tax=Vespula maculifrons TaxID=7453 RepID=A0ABD2AYS2_VESMC
MANNALSNGRIQQPTVSQRLRDDRTKKVADLPSIEIRNWLLHRHYTRREYRICKILIEEELTKSNGHNEYANYLKGLILRKEGKVQDSLDSFQAAYKVNSSNVNNVKQIAKSLLMMGSHKRAVEAYLEADKTTVLPDWDIHHSLGECYVKLNQLQEAKKQFKRSIELTKNELPGNPESVTVSTELGLLYLRIGDIQRAFQQFGTTLAYASNCSKALLPVAYIMQKHCEYDVALSKYKIAAQLIPESSALWNNVGMCFYGKQKFVAAISCLKRAHYLNPLAFLPVYNLGIAFLTTGQPASAAIYLCAAVNAESKNPMPYLLLGLALKRLDDLEGSVKALDKAHSLLPQDPLILINYAVILDATGKVTEASEVLSALNDIMAIIDVDLQIAQMAKKLSMKLQQQKLSSN